MHENHDFVVPVNILTPLRAYRFLGPHDTLPCVLISNYQKDIFLHVFEVYILQHGMLEGALVCKF